MREMLQEVKEFKNSICAYPFQDSRLEAEDEEIVIQILNTFNENDYLISDALKVLESCMEALKQCPVVRFSRW